MKIEVELSDILTGIIDDNATTANMTRNRWIELALINVVLRQAIDKIERKQKCQKFQ